MSDRKGSGKWNPGPAGAMPSGFPYGNRPRKRRHLLAWMLQPEVEIASVSADGACDQSTGPCRRSLRRQGDTMSKGSPPRPGRLLKAPENHLPPAALESARRARRAFMGKALAMGAGATAVHPARKAFAQAQEGDPAILELPPHSTGLGQPVVARGYGSPSRWEQNIQRRQSP